MLLWMAVTPDKYELPLVVATSAPELAKALGRATNTIRTEMSLAMNGRSKYTGKRSGYLLRKIEVED